MTTTSEHAQGASTPSSMRDRKSTRLNSSHSQISYAVFCLKKKKQTLEPWTSVSSATLAFVAASLTPHTRVPSNVQQHLPRAATRQGTTAEWYSCSSVVRRV